MNDNTHIFSVIIPHHEIPALLQRCLDSIPDVPEVQVIVVDDNSSEQKVDFEQFPGLGRKYTQCIFDKEGGGAGHARNIGMKHADGKWLVFADADDFFIEEEGNCKELHALIPLSLSIEETEELYNALKKTGYPENKMEKYLRNDLGELKKIYPLMKKEMSFSLLI